MPRDITEPLQTLPIYTAVFNRLGIAALVCTLIAIDVLPLMKRLSAAHNAQAAVQSSAAGGLPTIAAEE